MNKNNIELDLFSLDSEEIRFVQTKPFKTKLHFAVMLKFFKLENRFPVNNDPISPALIQLVANQLNVNSQLPDTTNWVNRTSERFRQEIRDFLGYRKATISDSEILIIWLWRMY